MSCPLNTSSEDVHQHPDRNGLRSPSPARERRTGPSTASLGFDAKSPSRPQNCHARHHSGTNDQQSLWAIGARCWTKTQGVLHWASRVLLAAGAAAIGRTQCARRQQQLKLPPVSGAGLIGMAMIESTAHQSGIGETEDVSELGRLWTAREAVVRTDRPPSSRFYLCRASATRRA